jgi:hypothetical protein
MKPTLDVLTKLYEAYDFFNVELFDNALPLVWLGLADTHRQALGWYCPDQVVTREPGVLDNLDEISLVMGAWASLSDITILSVLVHEMAHLEERVLHGYPKAGYHTKFWEARMTVLGLFPEFINGSRYKVDHEIAPAAGCNFAAKAQELLETGWKLNWQRLSGLLVTETGEISKLKHPKSKHAYACQCGTVYGGMDLNLFCNICLENLEPKE